METIESRRFLIISKDESLNLSEIDKVLNLASEAKVHIDVCKEELLEAIVRQIHAHKQFRGHQINTTHEIRHWASILHEFFFVENKRNASKEITQKSLETELFNTMERLFKQ